MGKKIGTKIMVMIVMSVMYLITSFASGFAQEQALGGLNRVYSKWVQLERYETKLVKATDNCNFYSNMIVHYKMPAVQKALAEGIDGINIAVDESAQGVTVAAQSTGALVEALVSIKGEADINMDISKSLQGEVSRFKSI